MKTPISHFQTVPQLFGTLPGRRCHLEQLESRVLLTANSLHNSALGSKVAELGSIQGYVLASEVTPQTLEKQSTGLADVRIELLNEIGQIVDQTETDSAGKFQFNDLPTGLYAIQEYTPDNYTSAGAKLGSGGGIVLNPDLIGEITLNQGTDLTDYKFFELAANSPDAQSDQSGQTLTQHSNATLELNGFLEVPYQYDIAKQAEVMPRNSSTIVANPTLRTRTATENQLTDSINRYEPYSGNGQVTEQSYQYDFDSVFDEILLQVAYHQEIGSSISLNNSPENREKSHPILGSKSTEEPLDLVDQLLDQDSHAASDEEEFDLQPFFVSFLP